MDQRGILSLLHFLTNAGDGSTESIWHVALSEMTKAAKTSPGAAGMSSTYSASPAHCENASSLGTRWPTGAVSGSSGVRVCVPEVRPRDSWVAPLWRLASRLGPRTLRTACEKKDYGYMYMCVTERETKIH